MLPLLPRDGCEFPAGLGGAVLLNKFASAGISACTFTGNGATVVRGTGASVQTAQLASYCCTPVGLARNSADCFSAAGVGGALWAATASDLSISASNFSNNQAGAGPGGGAHIRG